MITVNNARTKYMFDNRYGTGQSVWDGIMQDDKPDRGREKQVVVAGYGWCGRGIAMRAHGHGRPGRSLRRQTRCGRWKRVMDGYGVMPMAEAAKARRLSSSPPPAAATSSRISIFRLMKDGVGPLPTPVILTSRSTLNTWKAHAVKIEEQKPNIMGYTLCRTVKRFSSWREGRLVNLAAGDGHPVEIMDMSFAVQALSAKYVADHRGLR